MVRKKAVPAAPAPTTGRVRVTAKKAEAAAPTTATPIGRVRINPTAVAAATTSYFASSEERTSLEFFSTGCTLLDQVLGGGYVLGRMSNIIGDKSTGKTLMAIEGTVNFDKSFPDGIVRYAEAESAFDKPYAQALGAPIDRMQWVNWDFTTEGRPTDELKALKDKGLSEGDNDRTVERWYEDMLEFIDQLHGRPGLYILDSLDALSSRDELGRGISDASYGQEKAKKIGELFRRLIGPLEKSRCAVIIISQVRDNIGVTFGEKHKRSGGHAMDFYATHCLWLAYTGAIKRTVAKIERAVGVKIEAKCKKNKVGMPHRGCKFNIMFGYGIDDVEAGLAWLIDAGKGELLAELDMSVKGYTLAVQGLRNNPDRQPLRTVREKVNRWVTDEWRNVEQTFLPHNGKY